jgi:hypothetical protein
MVKWDGTSACQTSRVQANWSSSDFASSRSSETLGEPVVDGRYEVRRLPALVFPDQDPCQVRGGSEFEKARFLSAGYAQGIAQIFLDNSGWGTLGVQQ